MRDSLTELAQQLDQFAKERDWQQFRSPKSLDSALVLEVGEAREHFQWLTDAQSGEINPVRCQPVGTEVANVLQHLHISDLVRKEALA